MVCNIKIAACNQNSMVETGLLGLLLLYSCMN